MKKEMLVYSEKLHFEKEHSEFAAVMELIKAVRAVRTEMAVHPTKKTRLIIETQLLDAFESSKFYLQKFAFAEVIELFTKYERDTKGSVSLVTSTCRAYIPLNELIDKEKEQARLQKELLLVQKEIELFEGKLANAGFVQKAPEKLLLETKEKLSNAKAKKQKLLQSINSL